MSTDQEVMAAWLAEAQQRAQQAFQTLCAIAAVRGEGRMTPVDTGSGIPLIVNHVSYGKTADVASVLAGTAIPEWILGTADGRGAYTNEWHDGEPTSEDWVYVERWSARGREFHGWVDRQTRRVVQTG